MYQGDAALADVHDIYTKAKRAAPVQQQVPQNVVIGIILAAIAVIACAIVGLLLWRLKRQARRERRQANQVDLLGPEPFVLDGSLEPGGTSAKDPEKGLVDGRWDGKPLPRIPSGMSVRPYSAAPNFGNNQLDGPSVSPVHVICPPLPVMARQGSMRTRTPNGTMTHNTSFSHSSTTTSHPRTQSAPSVDGASINGRPTSSNPFSSESSVTAEILRGQFTVINVTEPDGPRFQRPQMLYNDLPPNYTRAGVRGRDTPFPSKKPGKARPPSIMTPMNEDTTNGIPSPASPFSWEKREFFDGPSTPGASYTVQMPISQPATPGSPFTPQRFRSPLTITASRPVSNIVVEDRGAVRRPDGTKGKGRMVTMSVMVEESDDSSSDADLDENPPELRERRSESRESRGDDILGELVERYAMDLPPYTPVHEYCSVPVRLG